MGFVQGEGRTQGSWFPVRLEELIPDYRIFGHPRFPLRELNGARTEMTMVYNLKRMMKVLGASQLRARLAAV